MSFTGSYTEAEPITEHNKPVSSLSLKAEKDRSIQFTLKLPFRSRVSNVTGEVTG